MSDLMTAGTVTITGHGGDEIEAYFAFPSDATDQPRVVVLHHMPGFDPARRRETQLRRRVTRAACPTTTASATRRAP